MKSTPGVAVFGAGNWGRNHVRVFHRLGALAAVVETDARRRAEVAEQYPGISVYAAPGPMLADAAVDAVVIATPAPTHYALARAALGAGKDVLVEKPMTLSVREAEELVAAAAERDRVLLLGHLLLYKPAVKSSSPACGRGWSERCAVWKCAAGNWDGCGGQKTSSGALRRTISPCCCIWLGPGRPRSRPRVWSRCSRALRTMCG
ncbi:MAG: Gfo/Idh/MocA family oxidoreductase [Bacillota bacterium]